MLLLSHTPFQPYPPVSSHDALRKLVLLFVVIVTMSHEMFGALLTSLIDLALPLILTPPLLHNLHHYLYHNIHPMKSLQ